MSAMNRGEAYVGSGATSIGNGDQHNGNRTENNYYSVNFAPTFTLILNVHLDSLILYALGQLGPPQLMGWKREIVDKETMQACCQH
ncbi:hypothetical protein FPOAC1_007863 [Fusarium poae]|uniref:hypothetical protein n=1 Tax=Fusarium poae TaxID=36050 RepID=UPI001CE89646|nr:hypothetical protein FPOAC1_007863 [Fusarium poae]KAG8668482.1 hypothetical protein FPOAC1_007863 [Fusarium poae]